MVQLSPLAKLDLVLTTIARNSHPLHEAPDIEHRSLLNILTDNGNNNAYLLDFYLILEKLLEDGNIKERKSDGTHIDNAGLKSTIPCAYYSVTFKGSVLIQQKGYTRKNKLDNRNLVIAKAATLAAIVVGIYYFAEFLRSYIVPMFSCHSTCGH